MNTNKLLTWSLATFLGSIVAVSTHRCEAQNQISLAQFDSWIFQTAGRDEEQCRRGLQNKIELQFVRIEQSTPLTESQKDCLRLAGQGDIKRFFDRVNQAREKFLRMEHKDNNANINEAYQLASPLQQELSQGIFGDGSLMEKATRYVMTDDQTQQILERELEQSRVMMELQGKVFLSTIGRGMALTAKQQRELQGHFQKKIQQLGNIPATEGRSSVSGSLFIMWLVELANDDDSSHFDDEQMVVIKRLENRANDAIPMLKLRGLVK
ncbi:hypothetical protein [Rhodopirellula europaea]|nr:hypothetical protein [Rhodopirellula europaea]